MARKQVKTAKMKVTTTVAAGDAAVDAFLTDLYEARRFRDDLEKDRRDLSLTEVILRKEQLPLARKRVAELEQRYRELRGDCYVDPDHTNQTVPEHAPIEDWRMKFQAEAWEYWIRLVASGCNPTVHSILDPMVIWGRENDVRSVSGIYPSSGHLRNTVLGGKHWKPPTHSVEQAKAHVAQLAQVAHHPVTPEP